MSLGLIWLAGWAVQGLGGSWEEEGAESPVDDRGAPTVGVQAGSRRRTRGTIDGAAGTPRIKGRNVRRVEEVA